MCLFQYSFSFTISITFLASLSWNITLVTGLVSRRRCERRQGNAQCLTREGLLHFLQTMGEWYLLGKDCPSSTMSEDSGNSANSRFLEVLILYFHLICQYFINNNLPKEIVELWKSQWKPYLTLQCVARLDGTITILNWGKMTKWWYQSIIWCMPPKEGGMFLGKVVPLSWGSSHRWLKAEGCHYQKEVLGTASQNFVHIFFHIFEYFK